MLGFRSIRCSTKDTSHNLPFTPLEGAIFKLHLFPLCICCFVCCTSVIQKQPQMKWIAYYINIILGLQQYFNHRVTDSPQSQNQLTVQIDIGQSIHVVRAALSSWTGWWKSIQFPGGYLPTKKLLISFLQNKLSTRHFEVPPSPPHTPTHPSPPLLTIQLYPVHHSLPWCLTLIRVWWLAHP